MLGGYNEAVNHINEDLIFFLNNDAVLDQNHFLISSEFLKKAMKLVLLSPVLSIIIKEKYEYAGASGGFIDFLAIHFAGRVVNNLEIDKYNTTREVFWASGCCFVVRKIFTKLNGFDDEFFAHMEEIDFCWRLKK